MKNLFQFSLTLKRSFFLIISLSLGFSSFTQEVHKATFTSKAISMKKVPSLASRLEDGSFIYAEKQEKIFNPKKSDGNKVVPGKGLPIGKDPLLDLSNENVKIPTKEPIITWDAAFDNSTPTDPTGAVGPSHFVNAWNTAFRVWDKEGNPLTPAASLANIWEGEDDGDPIVMYDKFADRFIITQFTGAGWGSTGPGFLIAISEGNDPVNDEWYTYEYLIDAFPDYPKYSVWSDAYYITANKNSGSASTSNVVYALERDKIISGDSTAQIVGFPLPDIVTNGFYSPLGFNVNGPELPATGNAPIIYLQDDSWEGVSTDHLNVWNINVDWDSTENSTISDPQEIDTEAFDSVFNGGSFNNLAQPSGPDIDALQATIMYMAQYRKFENYNATVLNFVVDLDNDDSRAGIRWFELRQDNDSANWSIFQEGTYEQPDGHSAFCGGIAMDSIGNIGLAYSVVSETQSVSIRYTGRYAGDPMGQMTLSEGVIEEGVANDPSTRYGDYGQMTLDPSDDVTFWHIAEYFDENDRVNKVGAFKLAPEFNIDAGVIALLEPGDGSLSANETISIMLRNFGSDTIWNIPVSYQIDGGTAVSETYADTLLPTQSAPFSFTQTADLSSVGQAYEIKAYTSYEGDEDLGNDTLISTVNHLLANDIGVSNILEPVSGENLSLMNVSIMIRNFGSATQSDFEVSYQLDTNAPVSETVSGSIESLDSLEYTFATQVEITAFGEYSIQAYTSLDEDADLSNDSAVVTVEFTMCTPEINCSLGDGLRLVKVTTLNNPSGCSPNGYGDFTDQSAELSQGSTNLITFSADYGNQYVKTWIDFNDNFVFESDEIVVDDFVLGLGPGMGAGSYTDSTELVIDSDAALGEHLMRAKSNWNSNVPDNACASTTYGETEDYTATITLTSAIDDYNEEPNGLIISYLPNNHFEVSFTAVHISEPLIISVHNSLGQRVINNRVNNVNGSYKYDFDMSYAAPGVYLVRLGSSTFGKVQKIVVK
jgi:hypothetical protein